MVAKLHIGRKMISKLNRAESQMKHFSNLNPGTVEHVQYQKKARYDNIQIGFKWGEDSSSLSEEKKMEVKIPLCEMQWLIRGNTSCY